MTRFLLTAYCALLSVAAWAQGKPPAGGCPAFPAQCQVNAQVFNFGRAQMSLSAPPVNSNASISVTCTRLPQDRLRVDVQFELWGEIVQTPPRAMIDQATSAFLTYDLFVDPTRTRLWGSGHYGSFPLQGACFLDDRNRVCTIPFVLYGTVFGGQSQIPPGRFLGAVVTRLEYQFSNCQPGR